VTETIPIPPIFLKRMSGFLGEEFPAFCSALEQSPVHGLRLNTLKCSPEQFQSISPFRLGTKIPWCPSAFLLEGEERPGKHPFHLAGLYYLQDPSAMAPAELLAPQSGERVLDLTAAPGGKTTHLVALMQGRGLLVANEIKTKRLNHLVVNVERWGAANIVVTNETPERLADHFGPFFDRVLVDAPCSGEGMFRKDLGARADWSEQMVQGCALRQGNILRLAARLVRPGGHLLYSTCTFAPEEDEAVISRFLDSNRDFEVEALHPAHGFMPGRPDWLAYLGEKQAHTGIQNTLVGAVRLFPHRLSGEGHFACLLHRLAGDGSAYPDRGSRGQVTAANLALWNAFKQEYLHLDVPVEDLQVFGDRLYLTPEDSPDLRGLRVSVNGIWLGNFKKDRFEPAHPLALFLPPDAARNSLDLPSDSQEINTYLRGGLLNSSGDPGWVLIKVAGWPLGWGKRVQDIVKNHYPRGLQIYS
jgi:NOL1/NOP2/sun family putative RNA methylase